MEQLEKLCRWLQGFPGWQELLLDRLEHRPGCAGLFPQGLQILSAQQNVLGDISCRCRWTFRLDTLLLPGREHTGFLMEFQDWVLRQCAKGSAPAFGDVPELERIYAQHGKLREATADGWSVYTVMLTVEFAKGFED